MISDHKTEPVETVLEFAQLRADPLKPLIKEPGSLASALSIVPIRVVRVALWLLS
jgi:hypothetical protein